MYDKPTEEFVKKDINKFLGNFAKFNLIALEYGFTTVDSIELYKTYKKSRLGTRYDEM